MSEENMNDTTLINGIDPARRRTGEAVNIPHSTDEPMMTLDDIVEMLGETEQKISLIMLHVRIWQFALEAGMEPKGIVQTLSALVSKNDVFSLTDAITAYAIWSSLDHKPLTLKDDFVGNTEFQTWRKSVVIGKETKAGPSKVAEAVRHDYAVAAGFHDCTRDAVGDLVQEAREAEKKEQELTE